MSRRESRNDINKAEHRVEDAIRSLDSEASALQKECMEDLEEIQESLESIRKELRPESQKSMRSFS